MDLDFLLTLLSENKGSDLHLKAGAPPIMRKNNTLSVLKSDLPVLSIDKVSQLVQPIILEIHRKKLLEHGSVDIGYGMKGVGRFRFNVFFQRGSIRVVARHIPINIPSLTDLNLPEKKIVKLLEGTDKGGLILIAGATGSGKSSTLASIINYINKTKNKHIVTIEDPIEFLIKDHHSLITQIELGVDCFDPVMAFKSVLRQDPDIILFSEIRLQDTILSALRAAETGHLVLTTIHTQDAAETINRILGSLDPQQQKICRSTLANVLKAVISQRLLLKKDKSGFIPAVEILINTAQVRKEIEEEATTEHIRTIMKRSTVHWGMQTFDASLIQLLKNGLISQKEALENASSPENIKASIAGVKNQDISWMEPEDSYSSPIKVIKKP